MPNGVPNFRRDPTFDPHAALRQKLRDQSAQQQQQQKQDETPASSAASISSERSLISGKNEPSPAPRKNLLKEMVLAIKSKQR